MQAEIPKVFRIPRPRRGIKRGYKRDLKRPRVYERNLKKRILAKEIAVERWKEKTAENGIQPQPIPMDNDGTPEEIKYQKDLRKAYRIKHYQTEYVDPTPFITDHVWTNYKYKIS